MIFVLYRVQSLPFEFRPSEKGNAKHFGGSPNDEQFSDPAKWELERCKSQPVRACTVRAGGLRKSSKMRSACVGERWVRRVELLHVCVVFISRPSGAEKQYGSRVHLLIVEKNINISRWTDKQNIITYGPSPYEGLCFCQFN